VHHKVLSLKAKELLATEFVLLFALAAPLVALMFLHSYTFHFDQLTLNYYVNGKADFTTDAGGLVRSLATVAVLTLVIGSATGAAIGLTFSSQLKLSNSEKGLSRWEEDMTKSGFVEINRTDQATTYKLTVLGRRFLRDYSFLEKAEDYVG